MSTSRFWKVKLLLCQNVMLLDVICSFFSIEFINFASKCSNVIISDCLTTCCCILGNQSMTEQTNDSGSTQTPSATHGSKTANHIEATPERAVSTRYKLRAVVS